MRLQKICIGRRSQRSESYISKAVGAVAVANDSGSVVFDKADCVGSENGKVVVITKLANED